VALTEAEGGKGEEQAMSPTGVLMSLETLALQRHQRSTSWNLAEEEVAPSEGFEASSDDELNTSIGELTMQASMSDSGAGMSEFGRLEDYGKGLMTTDSGVHSG